MGKIIKQEQNHWESPLTQNNHRLRVKTTRLLVRINRNNDMYTLNNKLWDMLLLKNPLPLCGGTEGEGSGGGNELPWKVEMGR